MTKLNFRKLSETDPRIPQAKQTAKEWRQQEGLLDISMDLGLQLSAEFYNIYRDAVIFPSGKLGIYLRMEMAPQTGQCVAAIVISNGKILLLEQERYPARKVIWETPRGFGKLSEPSETSIRREVEEETGGKICQAERIGGIYTNSGLSNEFVELYYVEIENVGVSSEEGVIKLRLYSLEEIEKMIGDGEIHDPFFISAYSISKERSLI